MKKSIPLAMLAVALGMGALVRLQIHASEQKAAAPKTDYPLTTCVVSDEQLGKMGKPVEYHYKQPGKPERIIYFCCKMCIKDFEDAPEVYLRKLDAATARAERQQASNK